MADDVLLWPPTCTCNKYIGHLAKRYYQLKQQGVPPSVAMTSLGIIDICCRTNVLTPTAYSMSATQSGSIQQHTVDPSQSVRSFPIRGQTTNLKSLTYGLPVSSKRLVKIERKELEEVEERERLEAEKAAEEEASDEEVADVSDVPEVSETTLKGMRLSERRPVISRERSQKSNEERQLVVSTTSQFTEVEEPVSEFDLSKMTSGKVEVVGFLRDDDGNIVTEEVGHISKKIIRVPVLKLVYKI